MKLYGKEDTGVAVVKEVVKTGAPSMAATIAQPAAAKNPVGEDLATASARAATVSRAARKPAEKIVVNEEPGNSASQAVAMSAVAEPQQEQAAVQKSIQPLAFKNSIEASGNSHTVMANHVDMRESELADRTPKRKIRSIGGLVNYVVGKVDPRDDKVIEFTDNDEGTEVSGINLGLLKIKSKNNTTNK